jgi:sialate O-acetylesterase
MNVIKILVLSGVLCLSYCGADAQQANWNNHQCAVVLTYDDGLNVHLDKVIPVLDSLGFKGTFYIPGNAGSLKNRIPEWRTASQNGHELGNHTLFHPCAASPAGREWVDKNYDLDNYSIRRIMDELKTANVLLKAIDGKDNRTFAYTCGDMNAGNESFYELLKQDFSAARSVNFRYENIKTIDLYKVGSYMVMGQSGEELISKVQEAMKTNTLLVFLFHGVGGEHSINVSLEAHNELLHFLKLHEKEIWVAPMVDVATFLNANPNK